MTVELIRDIRRYQALSTDTKPPNAPKGSLLFEEDTGKEFIKAESGWVAKAVEILGDNGFPLDDNHPLPIGGDSIYSKNIDIEGSDIGTFSGAITDLVDDLDTTISDDSATNPKYFEIKFNRPIDNSGIKFCSPVGENFSNVKIILKDRAGTILRTIDDTANSTKYASNEYFWPLTAFCSIRVEFHTADDVDLNWALLEISKAVHREVKFLDNGNSTTETLTIDEQWVGEWVNTRNYVQALIDVVTDQPSATNGLVIELSNDGVTAVHSHSFSILSNTPDGHHYPSELDLPYYRVKYTNGGVAQGTFKLFSTLFDTMVEEGHQHDLTFSLEDDHPAPIVRGVTVGKDVTGEYRNVGITSLDGLKVSNIESGLAIARGDVPTNTFIHKFGNAPDFDDTDGLVTVWDGASDGGINQMTYNYSTSAIIDSLSSSNNGDTQLIEVWGLDSNYDFVIQYKALTGQTRVALDTSLIRMFRLLNRGSTDLAGTVYGYENTALTLGVPNDTTKIRAVIVPPNNQTLMAVYTIPNGTKGYMRDWFASTSGAKRTSVHVIKLAARPFGEVFQTKHVASISASGSSNIHHKYEEPEVFEPKTDLEMLANSDEPEASVAAGFDIVLEDI